MANPIKHIRIGRIELIGNLYIKYTIIDDVEVSVADLIELNNEAAIIAKQNIYPVQITVGHRVHFEENCFDAELLNERANFTIAEAISIQGLPSRIAVRFYYKKNKPLFDTCFFKKENEALKWLKENYINYENSELHSGKLV